MDRWYGCRSRPGRRGRRRRGENSGCPRRPTGAVTAGDHRVVVLGFDGHERSVAGSPIPPDPGPPAPWWCLLTMLDLTRCCGSQPLPGAARPKETRGMPTDGDDPVALHARYQEVRGPTEASRGPAVGRGPDGPVDARRQPDQVAPGAHDVVLRDVHARARAAPLPPVPPGVRLPLQLVLRGDRRPASAGRARPDLPARGRRGRRLPRATSTRPWLALLAPPARRETLALIELGVHHEQQHQELLLMDIKHALRATRCSRRTATPRPTRGAPSDAEPAAAGGAPGGLVEIGHAGARLRLRQRVPAPPGYLEPVRARRPPGHLRRVAGVHRRRRLPPARAVAVRRLGSRPGRATGRPRCTGPRRRRAGSVFTLGGAGRSIRPSRSAT